jgi:CRISPR/Cas system CSM-associated protein Csm5 (group 7 of RAMP superfamily)
MPRLIQQRMLQHIYTPESHTQTAAHINSSAKDCKRMGLNNFDIVVENPQGVYYPGSTIMGVVRITIVGEAKKVRGECELRPP